jgi:hypothetical protein
MGYCDGSISKDFYTCKYNYNSKLTGSLGVFITIFYLDFKVSAGKHGDVFLWNNG